MPFATSHSVLFCKSTQCLWCCAFFKQSFSLSRCFWYHWPNKGMTLFYCKRDKWQWSMLITLFVLPLLPFIWPCRHGDYCVILSLCELAFSALTMSQLCLFNFCPLWVVFHALARIKHHWFGSTTVFAEQTAHVDISIYFEF